MRSWTPLWSLIVDSSIWEEPDHVRIVWVTMLALKDSDDVCRGTAFQLARRAHKTEREVLDALRVLSSPDTIREEPQEHGGRRIQAVEDGWLILNGAKYREMMQKEMEKARWRRAQAKQRLKQKGQPLPGEVVYEKMVREGASESDLDRHVASFQVEKEEG
jgi:hypothetical protein